MKQDSVASRARSHDLWLNRMTLKNWFLNNFLLLMLTYYLLVNLYNFFYNKLLLSSSQIMLNLKPWTPGIFSRNTRWSYRHFYLINIYFLKRTYTHCEFYYVGGSTQVPDSFNNTRNSTWGLPQPVKLQSRHITFTLLVRRKTPPPPRK